MMGRQLPALSSAAKALLLQERECSLEDQALKLRALERARAALEHERPSGIALRAAGAASGTVARRRLAPRAVLLIAAAVASAGLAAAGARVYRYASSPAQVWAPLAAPVGALSPSPAPVVAAAPESPASVAPSDAAAGPRRSVAPVESAHASSVQIYAIELGLLEPARSSIARGDYAGALSAIARHQREYPRGQLTEEREALRVRALWGMGQKPAAEGAAASFRKRYPKSGLLNWMKEPAK